MPVNINGYALSNSSGLSFGASGTKVVAANYGIRDPTLPGMMGSATAAGPYKAFPFVVNDVNVNIGSPWSVSTYAFTAPVAGIYYTSYGGIVGNGAGQGAYFAVIVNGASLHFSYRDSDAQWELHHIELMVKLAAGDTLQWAMNNAPGEATATTGGAYTSNHNVCTIWLIG